MPLLLLLWLLLLLYFLYYSFLQINSVKCYSHRYYICYALYDFIIYKHHYHYFDVDCGCQTTVAKKMLSAILHWQSKKYSTTERNTIFWQTEFEEKQTFFLSDRSHKGIQVIQIIKRKNTATTFFAFVCVGVNAESHHHWLRLRLSFWTSNVLYAFYSF